MTTFEFIRKNITDIADTLLAVDGSQPVWSYPDLTVLLDELEKRYDKTKYRCDLSLDAENETTGTMMLTRDEYELVKRVADIRNWDNLEFESYSGGFDVYCDELEEV